MGRKGVSKRKKAKEKVPQITEINSPSTGRNGDKQPEQVGKKGKTWSKDNKKN